MLFWKDIEGQQRPKNILERAIQSEHVHHAYLFTGAVGVGKFQVAHAMAAIVNCPQRPDHTFQDYCGECPSCRKIGQMQHPDMFFVEPEGNIVKNIKIGQIREIQKAAARTPYEAKIRVVIINDAHLMTEEASNALLKTLEEPSSRMRMILVTDQPHRLLDTILSRCQTIRFGTLPQSVVIERIREIAATDPELAEITSDFITVAAGYSEGSLGRALNILRSDMLQDRREFLTELLTVDRQHPRALLALAESWAKSGPTMSERLDVLKLFFRDIMLFKTSGAHRVVNIDLLDLIEKQAQARPMDAILQIIDDVFRAQDLLTRNVNAQLILEDLLRQLATFNNTKNNGRLSPTA